MSIQGIDYPTAIDLSEKRRYLGVELFSNIFLSEEENKIIFAPVHIVESGFYVEQETPIAIHFESPINEIGSYIKQSLISGERVRENLQLSNLSDWPSYKISKLKSKKAFKSAFTHIKVETINTIIRLEGTPKGRDNIFVGGNLTLACSSIEIGNLLIEIYQSCQKLSNPLISEA